MPNVTMDDHGRVFRLEVMAVLALDIVFCSQLNLKIWGPVKCSILIKRHKMPCYEHVLPASYAQPCLYKVTSSILHVINPDDLQ